MIFNQSFIVRGLLEGICFLFLAFSIMGCGNDNKKESELVPEVESPQFIDFDSTRAERVENYFKTRFSKKQFNGVFLFREGEKLISGAHGYLNFEQKLPLSDSTRFQLASLSKPFTATAFMRLVEQGIFDLDTDLRDYLPDFPYEGISPRLLLCHRSGLPNYMYLTDSLWLEVQVPDSIQGRARRELVGEVAGTKALTHEELYHQIILLKPPLYYPPDKVFSYCNTNYFLLAYLMEQKLEKPFFQILDSLVFREADMNMSFCYDGMRMDTLENSAIGYTARFQPYVDFYLNGVLGDKGMYSNVYDLLSFVMAIEDGLLGEKTKEEMFRKQTKTNKRRYSYGLGWRIKKYKRKKLIFHNGWWRGFRTYFMMYPSKNRTVIVLTNSTMGGFLSNDELMGLLD